MKFQKKERRYLFYVLILCVFLRILQSFPLDNSNLLGGADFSFHFFRVWDIFENGYMRWNGFWYAGFPFEIYSPMSHFLGSSLAGLVGFLLSYKFFIDLVFVLTPIAFFLFLKEFNLSPYQMMISLVLFSLIPLYSYYQFDGRYPALMNIFFGLIYWKFLKRSIDNWNKKEFLITSLFFSLMILVHSLTAVIFGFVTFFWALSYSPNLRTAINFSKIILLSFLFSSFWLVPFIFESLKVSTFSQAGTGVNVVGRTFENIIFIKPLSYYFVSEFSFVFVWISLLVMLFFSSLSLFLIKKRNVKALIFSGVGIVLLIIFLKYNRALIVLPIPLSILAGYGASLLKKSYFLIPFIVFLTGLGFFSLRYQVFSFPEIPQIPQDGRVLFLPSTVFALNPQDSRNLLEVFLSPLSGNPNIIGWFPESQSAEKKTFNDMILNPFNYPADQYQNFLDEGWVNYLVVGKQSPSLIDYFGSNPNFTVINETNDLILFGLNNHTSYLEINSKQIMPFKTDRKNDEILVNFTCSPGKLLVKESFHPNLEGKINGEIIQLEKDPFGFTTSSINNTGPCLLDLQFKEPLIYYPFYLISPLVLISYLFVYFSKKK